MITREQQQAFETYITQLNEIIPQDTSQTTALQQILWLDNIFILLSLLTQLPELTPSLSEGQLTHLLTPLVKIDKSHTCLELHEWLNTQIGSFTNRNQPSGL